MKELQELYASYYQDLYDWFYYRCGNKHLAEDLTQDTFVQVIRSIANFQGKSSERTWMLGIARYVWLSHLRKQKPTVELHDQVWSRPQEEPALYQQVLEQIKQRDEKAYTVEWRAIAMRRLPSVCNVQAQVYVSYFIAVNYGYKRNGRKTNENTM